MMQPYDITHVPKLVSHRIFQGDLFLWCILQVLQIIAFYNRNFGDSFPSFGDNFSTLNRRLEMFAKKKIFKYVNAL